MSNVLERVERKRLPLLEEVSFVQESDSGQTEMPKVLIRGDIHLRVTVSDAALRPVNGYYRIETQGMQEPLQIIWMIEGTVINHTVFFVEVAFDVRGMLAGETLTRLLTAQVTDTNGQGRIVHSSVFIQIFVVRDDHRISDSGLNTLSS